MPNKGTITRVCDGCGASFTTYAAWVKRGGRFCTMACRSIVTVARDAYFTPKVDRSGDCWNWTGAIDADGYGHAWDPVEKRRIGAHQLAYVLASGAPIPVGGTVCHTCDNRACMRNDERGVYVLRGVEYPRYGHLWLGTSVANTADKMEKGRHVGARLGERNHNAKLTEDAVRDMVKWYARGMATSSELGRIFGLRREGVATIARGVKWKHLGLTPIRKCAPYKRHRTLTVEERASVIAFLKTPGSKQSDAAEHFGISKSLVSLIVVTARQG